MAYNTIQRDRKIVLCNLTMGLKELSWMSLIATGRVKVNCTELSCFLPIPLLALVMLKEQGQDCTLTPECSLSSMLETSATHCPSVFEVSPAHLHILFVLRKNRNTFVLLQHIFHIIHFPSFQQIPITTGWDKENWLRFLLMTVLGIRGMVFWFISLVYLRGSFSVNCT